MFPNPVVSDLALSNAGRVALGLCMTSVEFSALFDEILILEQLVCLALKRGRHVNVYDLFSGKEFFLPT